jgi:hypothetical protein
MTASPAFADNPRAAHCVEFWPEQPAHMVSHLPLNPRAALPEHLRKIAPELQQLAAIVNAARVLEDAPTSRLSSRQLRYMEYRAADAVSIIARDLRAPADRAAAAARVTMLRGNASQPADVQILHQFRDTDLFLFCGRLRTWFNKGDNGMMSALAAVPSRSLNRVVEALEPALLLETARKTLPDGEIVMAPPPLFVVSELIMCAGEANRHPKHFAYFFPEDEFLPGGGTTLPPGAGKTVLFANLYWHRFATSSFPRLERFTKGIPLESLCPTVLTELLVLWMRGHDLGHSVRYAETDLVRNQGVVGKFPTMALEEALADCYGFLTVAFCRDDVGISCPDSECAKLFVGEMLRYLGRGIGVFQDSDAALIELAFLQSSGAVSIAGDKLVIIPERLLPSVLQLTAALQRALLRSSDRALTKFAEEYLPPDGAAVKRVMPFVKTMLAASRDLPNSTTYSTRY